MDCNVETRESKPGTSEQSPHYDGIPLITTIANREVNFSYLLSEEVWNRNNHIEAQIVSVNTVSDENLDNIMDDQIDEAIFEPLWKAIDKDPIKNFHYFHNESLKNNIACVLIAKNISVQSIIKLCGYIYDVKEFDEEFLDVFHNYFLITLLKRKYNWFTMDLMIKSSVIYTGEFYILIEWLVKDLDVTNQFLVDYAKIIDMERKTEIMEIFSDINFTKEEFAHNLLGIYYLFDGCIKTNAILHFILDNMILTSKYCARNKNYGKLLLSVLKELHTNATNLLSIKKLVNDHGTVYKAPCQAILDGNALERLHLQVNLINRPRIMIPRENNRLSLSL